MSGHASGAPSSHGLSVFSHFNMTFHPMSEITQLGLHQRCQIAYSISPTGPKVIRSINLHAIKVTLVFPFSSKVPVIGLQQTGRIGLCSVLRPRQHSIGYMGDGQTDEIQFIGLIGLLYARRRKKPQLSTSK